MKVMLVNGSPRRNGCTRTALNTIKQTLISEGIATEDWWIGNKPISGCLECYACVERRRCVIDDQVNEFVDKAAECDGFIIGSPVFYAGINGSLKCFLDRAFYSASKRDPHPLRFKPAAAVVSARRSGTTASLEQINRYFLHQQMPVISSRYWNMVHGYTPEEVLQDEEGLQIMRFLGRNMAWFLKLREAGDKAGVPLPVQEPRINTNFIR